MRFKALEAEKLLDMEGPCRPLQVSGGPRPWQEGPGGFWKVVQVSSKVLPGGAGAPGGSWGGPWGPLAPGGPPAAGLTKKIQVKKTVTKFVLHL